MIPLPGPCQRHSNLPLRGYRTGNCRCNLRSKIHSRDINSSLNSTGCFRMFFCMHGIRTQQVVGIWHSNVCFRMDHTCSLCLPGLQDASAMGFKLSSHYICHLSLCITSNSRTVVRLISSYWVCSRFFSKLF